MEETLRNLTILGVLTSAALLCACGSKTACFAMSDEDATAKVVAEYAKLPAAEKGDPSQMQFSATRVVGVGRIVLSTADANHREVVLEGVPRPDQFRDWLTDAVQQTRRERGMREYQVDSL